jgi:hypothetical protein
MPGVDDKIREAVMRGEYELPFYGDFPAMSDVERRATWDLMLKEESTTKIIVDQYNKHGFDGSRDLLQSYKFIEGKSLPQWGEAGYGGALRVDWNLKTTLDGLYAAGGSMFSPEDHSYCAATGRYAGRKAVDYAKQVSQGKVSREQIEKEKVKSKSEISFSTPKVEIEGISNILVSLAKCCNPVKGEQITAYVTSKSEIKIHKENCPFLKRLNPANFKTAKWAEGESQQIVSFKVFGNNYTKMAQTISEIADSQKITINSLKKLQTKEGAGLDLQLIVNEVNHLNAFLNKIKSSKDITGIK